ncbi:hypothetical protein GCM10020369_28730 [Cryptosporangium minutisporangium]|uniref:Uncharacterized protein n=1 Tax=Cryptosporangium minutisporangium TaxID=113569 RepID=A0ABP6SYU3_9ACTN
MLGFCVAAALLGLAIVALNRSSEAELVKLSNIGQAFGALSALLSGIALVGVVISIRAQLQDVAVARAQSVRDLHLELSRMALDDWKSFGPIFSDSAIVDAPNPRSDVFTNQLIAFWWTAYEFGYFSPEATRYNFRELFKSEPGRDFWGRSEGAWRQSGTSSKYQTFLSIASAEYLQAVEGGPPSRPGPSPGPRIRQTDGKRKLSLLYCGAAGGAALAYAFLRTRAKR